MDDGLEDGTRNPEPCEVSRHEQGSAINFFHTGSTAFLVSGRVAKVAMVNSISALDEKDLDD
jgi:hypothetical protein